jgi:hypothetical protein
MEASRGVPKAVYVDYADPLVKPTPVRRSSHVGMLATNVLLRRPPETILVIRYPVVR